MTTPAVVEKQVVDIDLSGGLDEWTTPAAVDWAKNLTVAENVDFATPGILTIRPGLYNFGPTIAGSDDQGASLSSILRLMSTDSGVVAICGTGSDPYKVCQMNEAGAFTAFMTRKNRGSEYSVYPQTVTGMTGNVPVVIGTCYSTTNSAPVYNVTVYAGNTLQDFNVVLSDTQSTHWPQ